MMQCLENTVTIKLSEAIIRPAQYNGGEGESFNVYDK